MLCAAPSYSCGVEDDGGGRGVVCTLVVIKTSLDMTQNMKKNRLLLQTPFISLSFVCFVGNIYEIDHRSGGLTF